MIYNVCIGHNVVYDMLVLGIYNTHIYDLLWYSVGRGVRYTAGDGGQYRDLSHQHPRLILPAHRQVRVKNIIINYINSPSSPTGTSKEYYYQN